LKSSRSSLKRLRIKEKTKEMERFINIMEDFG